MANTTNNQDGNTRAAVRLDHSPITDPLNSDHAYNDKGLNNIEKLNKAIKKNSK
ncbi:hypothetical protein [Heyndrickxia acidiproducens]|uniref:hypothetical protein n=1 Tax=Heyndrickxia acidiproducens TaxID=1121084 RepID=UPI00036FCE58|nr:hypothetical protein [Heyndrickxia acidiproducens]